MTNTTDLEGRISDLEKALSIKPEGRNADNRIKAIELKLGYKDGMSGRLFDRLDYCEELLAKKTKATEETTEKE